MSAVTPIHAGMTDEMLCNMRKRVEQAIARLESNPNRSFEQEITLDGYQLILGEVMDEQDRRNGENR